MTVIANSDISMMLHNYRLTTAEILYHLPDHPKLLQSYVWQELDIAPRFPVLKKFLHFWENTLDGRLHSIRVASLGLIEPADYRYCNGEFLVH